MFQRVAAIKPVRADSRGMGSTKAILRWLALFMSLSVSTASASDGYTVGGSGGQAAIDVCSVCYTVTNYNTPSIYVPVNSCAEWSSFYSNVPGGVSLGSCFACHSYYTNCCNMNNGSCTYQYYSPSALGGGLNCIAATGGAYPWGCP